MADIKSYTTQIKEAKRGETVRDSITGALKTMVKDGINASSLNGRHLDYFALMKDVNEAFRTSKYLGREVMENSVVKGSTRAVTSGALYDMFLDLDEKFSDLLGD